MKILISPFLRFGRKLKQVLFRIRIRSSITHLSGPHKINLSKEDVIVLCLVKNAELVISDFINYYLSLGVQHLVFLDNGSHDRTVEIASSYSKVTVLRSYFPFRKFGDVHLREYLTDHYGFGVWSLCVDIDEYFDFPHSDVISLKRFINYLNVYNYTAVVTQMIDMFPNQIDRFSNAPFVRSEHRYYLVDNLVREKYKIWENPVQPPSLTGSAHVWLTGGIRKALFGATPCLTKHALIFRNTFTRRDRWGHFLVGGVLADVSGVLLHYKFTSEIFRQVEEAVKLENHFKKSSEYKQYHQVLKDMKGIDFPVSRAAIWQGTDKLIEEKLLSTSTEYEQWCSAGSDVSKNKSDYKLAALL